MNFQKKPIDDFRIFCKTLQRYLAMLFGIIFLDEFNN